jgi:hypothetical protein
MIRTVFLVPAIFVLAAGEPQQAVLTDNTAPQNIAVTSTAEEEDTGVPGFVARAPCEPVYSNEVISVGPVTGDSEKDTYARMAIGEVCR